MENENYFTTFYLCYMCMCLCMRVSVCVPVGETEYYNCRFIFYSFNFSLIHKNLNILVLGVCLVDA